METLYRKVAVSERKPKSSGFYWIENIVGEMKSSHYDSLLEIFTGDYANFWLEPIKSDQTQIEKLEAEKKELLEALEKVKKWGGEFGMDYQIYKEIESLIQKHKAKTEY